MAVVGDVLLDRDWDGEADRLSPEAPVPVVDVTSRRERAGGAGLAAVLAVADGHRVTLVTALGGDEAGRRVRELLAQAGVRVVDLGAAGPTVVKIRVRARGQTVLRVDEGTLSGGEVGAWTPEAADAIEAAQCVLVADYGRGVAASAGVRAAIAGRVGQVPIVWDPHPRGAQPVAGISVVVPNRDEAAAALHESTQTGSLAVDVDRARRLRAYWRVGYVAVTRGPLGAVLVDADATAPLVVGAPRVAVGDSSGAGDRFAVTMTAELGAAAGPSTAVARAVHAATGFVDAGHHTIVTAAGLEVPDGWGLVARMRAEGRTVVATGGCFDLLHAGHVETLRQARDLGDCLVVCLNSDASVARLKGAARPVVPVSERAALLQALGCVDAVLVFDEDTPAQLLRRMRPDIWVKGGDYAGVELPEQSVLAEWGGQVVLVPYREGLSTTTLIARAAGGVGR
ncbi:D-glycero-beta-D-manno-heptose 1-phosphate adenylyltransferase [Nocardia sp. alder85J]|uniref:D-glycero-beta-D-manno-heptose 1-phosphate adenylyltransferase n=1 Tax=Nocardia sp. alder85J TaxID=2862949 RepID=UPI001CD5BA86|nr:D-glycero-beta-D-manno-heptose 1-phosphate adenylyltransferase [Nocardia sp. alder85J]MCX4094569.1 D-glycero-beta-D-manno-heptose 1-phosphate adenylyltransferase [Nocardia sp. alder85J]